MQRYMRLCSLSGFSKFNRRTTGNAHASLSSGVRGLHLARELLYSQAARGSLGIEQSLMLRL